MTTWTPRPVIAFRIAASGADERLALAGPHLGDPTLVQDGATDELDVEQAHAEGPLHGLAGHREDLGQHVVHGLLEALVLALAPFLLQLAAALEVLVVELVIGRLVRLRELEDLLADLRELRADLVVGERLEFGFERVGLLDHRLDTSDLAVIRVDETGKELHGTVSIRQSSPGGPSLRPSPRSRSRSPGRAAGRSRRRGPARTART